MRALSKLKLLQRPPTPDDQIAAMRAIVKDTAGDRPAVYRMVAEDGEIVYVGKSKRVRSRLLSYFRCARDEKGARILRDAVKIEWDYVPSEFAALLTELRLIKKYRPRFNVAMKRDGRNYCFIKLTHGPAPKFVVVRGPGHDDSAVYYGPFMGAMGVADAVRELNDVLGLRDCAIDQKMHFADQPSYSTCAYSPAALRFEVKNSRPCAWRCTNQYNERAACWFRRRGRRPDRAAAAKWKWRASAFGYGARVLRDKFAGWARAQFGPLRFA